MSEVFYKNNTPAVYGNRGTKVTDLDVISRLTEFSVVEGGQ